MTYAMLNKVKVLLIIADKLIGDAIVSNLSGRFLCKYQVLAVPIISPAP